MSVFVHMPSSTFTVSLPRHRLSSLFDVVCLTNKYTFNQIQPMNKIKMTLLCPLCLGFNFQSVEMLLYSLISSSTQNIICPVCGDLFRGFDKFTVHLCSHVLIKCDQKPIDLNTDPGITHINKRLKNIRLNPSSFSLNDIVRVNNTSCSSENIKGTERPIDGASELCNLTVEEMSEIMSDYTDNVSSIVNVGRNYLNRSIDVGESETADFPVSRQPDDVNIRFTESFKPNSGENSASNASLDATNFTFEIHPEVAQQPPTSNDSTSNLVHRTEFAALNSVPLATVPESTSNSGLVRTPVSNSSQDIENSECDFLSQLTLILDQTNDCNFRNILPPDQFENATLTKTNNEDFVSEIDESSPLPSRAPNMTTTCNICSVSLPDDVGILNLHQELVHDKTPNKDGFKYNCAFCKRKFKIKGSLVIHQQVAHSDGRSKVLPRQTTNDELQHCCSICSKMFKKEYLNQHLKTHEEKKWACESCGKLFTTKYFLQKHKRLHTGEMPYVCPICDKQFTFQQTYHKHLIYHNDEKPYSCKECGKSFKELSTLYNHQRIHSGEKPYSCDICGKSFRQRVSCIIHNRIHTGFKPFTCIKCRKSFRYKISLKSHKCVQESTSSSV